MPEHIPTPTAEEVLRVLEPIADNRVYLPQLVQQMEADLAVIPVVGAGMSVPFRLPQWGPFLESLAPNPESRAAVRALLDAGRYEEAAGFVHELRGANSFQDLFSHNFAQIAREPEGKAAVRHLARFPSGPVVTTNFDPVLETVFREEGAPFSEVLNAAQRDRLARALELNLEVLIKLHGDGGDRRDRVLTFAEYESGYGTGPVRALLETLASRPLLFLGASLKADRTVTILKALATAGRQFARHFAVVEKPAGDAETAARLKELGEAGIRPIFFPPKGHAWIGPLLAFLATKTPAHRRRAGRIGPAYHNLAAPLGDMLGREAELEALCTELGRCRYVAVEGPRGVGKTTLILHALQRLKHADTFEALVWTTASVVRSAYGVGDLLDALSLTLDFPFSPQTAETEKAAITIAELERRGLRCLIAVDNYENITDPAVGELLTRRLPPSCTVLATSASVVPFPEANLKVLALDELPREPALALLRHRAREQGVEGDLPSDLDDVYALTGGNALALEWVVGRMRAGQPLFSVLASVRTGEAALLDEMFHGTWALLDERARRVLCAIAAFPSPPALGLVEAASHLAPGACAEAIQQLRQLYLVKIVNFSSAVAAADAQSRFVLHPVTREFAERQAEAALGEHLAQRAAAYFLEYVRQRGGTPELEEREDLRSLNQERLNILAVLERCRGLGDDSQVVALTLQVARWWFIEGHWTNLETWAEHAIAAAEQLGDRSAGGRLWAELGRVFSHRSQFHKAEHAFQQSAALAAIEPPDLRTLGYLKHHQAEAQMRRGLFDQARPLLEAAQAAFAALGSRRDLIGVGYRLAVLALEQGRWDDARAAFERGIEDTIDERWERLEGLHRRFLGELELRSPNPDFEHARYQLLRAARLISETDTRTHALIELSRARVELGLNRRTEAVALARAARNHFEKLLMRKEWEQCDRLLLQLGDFADPPPATPPPADTRAPRT